MCLLAFLFSHCSKPTSMHTVGALFPTSIQVQILQVLSSVRVGVTEPFHDRIRKSTIINYTSFSRHRAPAFSFFVSPPHLPPKQCESRVMAALLRSYMFLQQFVILRVLQTYKIILLLHCGSLNRSITYPHRSLKDSFCNLKELHARILCFYFKIYFSNFPLPILLKIQPKL